MNVASWLLWGFASTLLLTTTLAVSQALGLTRMNMPYMLGTMFTADRDRARLYGFVAHLVNGLVFSLLYVFVFQSWGVASWWRGSLIGVLHGLFVLVIGMAMLPGIHPRIASEQHGPTANRQLEPPGFMAINYGIRTPISVLVSHAVFGAVLGAFYKLA
ncbi:MAG: hypothetical protein DMG75_01300 [Acidobacteria bacterium]|nr:MAG: hypothetical protein DMG75_01300 [Acidobacteriota bacterium]